MFQENFTSQSKSHSRNHKKMKATIFKIILQITTIFAFVIGLTVSVFAQNYTHLNSYELSSFEQLRMDVDTEVILVKSDKNQLTLVGDSVYVFNAPINQENGVLTFNYFETGGEELKRITVEYQDISRVSTSGTGEYYFYNMDAKDLKIFNNSAKVKLRGKAEKISIFSEKGDIDVTEFQTKHMITHLGEAVNFQVPEDFYTVKRLN